MDSLTIQALVIRQYRASLGMMGQAIELCPEDLWIAPNYRNQFWRIAYHSLFYTHLYGWGSEDDFRPWSKHSDGAQYLKAKPSTGGEPQQIARAYSKAELLENLALCRTEVESRVPCLRLEEASGFDWLPFNKLELQFYNIRHLQHHTGQLSERLRTVANVGVKWVIVE